MNIIQNISYIVKAEDDQMVGSERVQKENPFQMEKPQTCTFLSSFHLFFKKN